MTETRLCKRNSGARPPPHPPEGVAFLRQQLLDALVPSSLAVHPPPAARDQAVLGDLGVVHAHHAVRHVDGVVFLPLLGSVREAGGDPRGPGGRRRGVGGRRRGDDLSGCFRGRTGGRPGRVLHVETGRGGGTEDGDVTDGDDGAGHYDIAAGDGAAGNCSLEDEATARINGVFFSHSSAGNCGVLTADEDAGNCSSSPTEGGSGNCSSSPTEGGAGICSSSPTEGAAGICSVTEGGVRDGMCGKLAVHHGVRAGCVPRSCGVPPGAIFRGWAVVHGGVRVDGGVVPVYGTRGRGVSPVRRGEVSLVTGPAAHLLVTRDIAVPSQNLHAAEHRPVPMATLPCKTGKQRSEKGESLTD